MEYIPSKFNLLVKQKNKSYYVYNTQSGSLCCFDEPTYLFLKSKNKLKKEEIPYFDNLLSQGFIVDSNLNEFNKIIFNQAATIFNQNPSRMSFVITPTLNCNLRCKYCFEGNSNKNDGFNDFVMNDCFEFIKRQLLKNKNVKNLTIDWFGGEPLLKLKEIRKFSNLLIKFCDENNIKYRACMLTNGVLLNKNTASILKNECRIDSVQVPMDGTEKFYCQLKQTNKTVYDTVVKNICDCCDILSLQVRLNTNRQNYEDIKKLAKYLLIDLKLYNKIRLYIAELRYFEDYTINISKESCLESLDFVKLKIDFIKYIKYQLGLDNYKYSYMTPKSVSCGLCVSYNCVIGPNGELYRCEHDVGRPECVIGTCNDGRYYNDHDMSFMQPKHLSKCKSCVMFPTCFCGCKSVMLLNGISKGFCKSMKIELKNLLKEKIVDIKKKKDTSSTNIRNQK